MIAYDLIPSKSTSIQQVMVEDAPLGTQIYRTSSQKAVVYSPHKPISVHRRYRLRGWIKRASFDNIPAGKYFVGALVSDFKKTPITGEDKWCYYYQIKYEEGYELTPGMWRYVEFEVGAGTDKPLPQEAKFLSLASLVNYETTTATYEFCGFDVVEIY